VTDIFLELYENFEFIGGRLKGTAGHNFCNDKPQL